jgi:hypothetical protein
MLEVAVQINDCALERSTVAIPAETVMIFYIFEYKFFSLV